MAKNITLSWRDINYGETEYRIYRSTATIDPNALPAPLATIPAPAVEWVDTTALAGTVYFYRVGVMHAGQQYVSAEISASYTEYSRSTVTIALVTQSTSHASATNTRNALIAAGFVSGNISMNVDTVVPPVANVIVMVRGCSTQAEWNNIKGRWDAGTPVIIGLTDGVTAGTGYSVASTFAGVTGTCEIISPTPGVLSNFIVDNTHPITSIYTASSSLAIYPSGNYGMAIDAAAARIGTQLATGDAANTAAAGKGVLLAVPAGTERLNALGPTGARAVFWGDLYAGQSAYNAAGAEYLARMVDWCVGGL